MSSDGSRPTAGGRLTANYRTILDVVSSLEPGMHASANDVYVRSRERRPKIGFVTVHRGLARLHELGYVLKLNFPGEHCAVYEPAAAAHAHFRCDGCGRIHDIPFTLARETRRTLEHAHGMAIDTEAITFTGRCAACSARPDPEIPG